MINIIWLKYFLITCTSLNAFFFFWPVFFFVAWSYASYKMLIYLVRIIFEKLLNKKTTKKIHLKFESEEEKKLFYLTRFNTKINKRLSLNTEKEADKGICLKKFFNPIFLFFFYFK